MSITNEATPMKSRFQEIVWFRCTMKCKVGTKRHCLGSTRRFHVLFCNKEAHAQTRNVKLFGSWWRSHLLVVVRVGVQVVVGVGVGVGVRVGVGVAWCMFWEWVLVWVNGPGSALQVPCPWISVDVYMSLPIKSNTQSNTQPNTHNQTHLFQP